MFLWLWSFFINKKGNQEMFVALKQLIKGDKRWLLLCIREKLGKWLYLLGVMAYNWVLTPHPTTHHPSSKITLPQIGNPPSPKIFYPPPSQSSNFLLLPPTGNGCFFIFHTWLLPTSTCSYFWSYYSWLNAVIIHF